MPRRYERLFVALAQIGIGRESIDLVSCARDAKHKLDTVRYDLFILDIMIPEWPEGVEDHQNAVDLLFAVHEQQVAFKPGYVLGITADLAAAGDALRQFEDWTWTVLEYSDTADEWVSRATNCAKYVLERFTEARQESVVRVDLAIVCALAKPEQEEVLKLPWNWSEPRPIDDLTFVRDGWLTVEGQRFTVCLATAPRMGMVSAALLSSTMIERLRPKLLAMTGICAGVRGKVKLGDVLFADPSWDFQSGKRVRDKLNTQFSIRPHQLPAPAKIRRHIEQLAGDKAALAKISTDYPDEAPSITALRPGPVASGSAVLADGEVIEQIKLQHQELIGVEMEIYGVYAAGHAASGPQPLYFALKGVCDFADPDKEDGHQRYAAYASARVLQLLVERYGQRLVS